MSLSCRVIVVVALTVIATATQMHLTFASNHHICSDGDVRLLQLPNKLTNTTSDQSPMLAINSSHRHLSLVQVCMSECWWYVDEAHWNSTSAAIACTTQGFHRGNNETDIAFGAVSIPVTSLVAVANVKCRGDELDFTECVMEAKHIPVNHTAMNKNDEGEGSGHINAGSGAGGSSSSMSGRDNHYGNVRHSVGDSNTDDVEDHTLNDNGSGSGDNERREDSSTSEMVARKRLMAADSSVALIKEVSITIGTLSCQAEVMKKPQPECTEHDIELISYPPQGGRQTPSSTSGVVRICYNGKWSLLCSSVRQDSVHSWTNKEAGVVCKYLGYAGQGAIAINGGTVPPDNTDVILSSRITCSNGYYSNPSLSSCKRYSSCKRVGNCPIGKQLASVQCEEFCQDGDVKYTTGIDHSNFFVVTAMVCESQVWRPICDNDWNYMDATVLCRWSGHSEYGALPVQFPLLYAREYRLVEAYGNVPMSINCEGNEQKLSLCQNQSSSSSCQRGGVSAAVCIAGGYARSYCITGDVRLLDTRRSGKSVIRGSGELQVCINNLWGRVGFNSMTKTAGVVICRQLGFNTTDPTIISSELEIEPLFVPRIACEGHEGHLSKCLEFPEPSFLLEEETHDGTKLICVNPPKVISLTPPHTEIHLEDSSLNNRQINYTCTVSGPLPITVEWYYQYYNSSTPKEIPVDSIDYKSLVMMSEGLDSQSINNIQIQEIKMISSEVLINSYQSTITIKELSPSKNGHYVCTASNAYGKDQRHGFLFISAKPSVELSFNPSTGIHGDHMTVTCTAISYYPELAQLNILKDNELIQSKGFNCSNTSFAESSNLYLHKLKCHIENTTFSEEGVYSCEASADSFKKYSNHHYKVQSFPIIDYLTPNTTINITNQVYKHSITLNCSVFGKPRPLIQWYKVDNDSSCSHDPHTAAPRYILIEPDSVNQYNITYIDGVYTTSLLHISMDIGHNTDTYMCYVVNKLGSVKQSTTVNVNVVQAKPVHVSLSINAGGGLPTILPRDRVYLTCSITSSSNLPDLFIINWLKDGHMITSHMITSHMTKAWNDTLILSSVDLNDTGLYSCSIANGESSKPEHLKIDEPLVVRLFNSSPQVKAGHMISYISINKPVSSCMCTITNMDNTKMNCSSGVVHFTDVWCKGPHRMIDFIVTARTDREDVTLRRQFYPEFNSYCAVNLINDGVTVNGSFITVEFAGVGHGSNFMCHIEDNVWEHCSSPWTTSVPRPGFYHLQIKPVGGHCRRDKIVFKQSITVD